MNINYKGVIWDLVASIGFFVAAVLRLWVQLTSSFSPIQILLNTLVVIVSVIIGIRFIYIYKCCIRITDTELIITEMIRSTKVKLNNISNIYEEKNKLSIFTKDNHRIKFELKDLSADDREDLISFLESTCSK